MLSKAIVFSFCFLGIFAMLFVAVPTEYMANQNVWSGSYFRTDQQVASFFNLHNITLYNSQATGTLHNTDPTYDHIAIQGGLPSGQQLDIWFDNDYTSFPGVTPYALGISYETQHFFLGVFEYWTTERLHYTSQAGADREDFIEENEVVADFSQSLNGTFYDARCWSGIQVTIVYTPPNSTMTQSWALGFMSFMLSYELNATASSISMFSLLGKILTFQAPSLGISGWFGDLLNNLIAIPIYAITGFIIYKLITGIAPWLSGGSGD